jgi:hypothetical protein
VVFIVSLFLYKNISRYENQEVATDPGLVYDGEETIESIVTRDTDLDGVVDWEESLWGTDPQKKDTDDDGIMDKTEVENLKLAQARENEEAGLAVSGGASIENEENLTQTDKFSRELFSTVAALSQAGEIDQATVDKLSVSLLEKIENPVQRKVFILSDLKISAKDDEAAILAYSQNLANVQAKYPVNNSVIDVLQKFILDPSNVDVEALSELDPIIEKMNKMINEIAQIPVPQSISTAHLNFLNALKRLVENTEDMKFFESDVVISLSAMSQYEANTVVLSSAIVELMNAIGNRLSN